MKLADIKRDSYYEGSIITTEDELVFHLPKIESLFRNSKIYKNYIYSIREGLDKKNCSYFTDKDFSNVSLELHHIFKLNDIVLLVGTKMLDELQEGEFLTVFDIVRGVIDFHLKDYPVVMMLSSTIHQLYHTGQYVLPRDSKEFYSGNYKDFIEEYFDYLDREEVISRYEYFGIDVSDVFNVWYIKKRE